MNYSQALESLIQEIVYYGDSAERREKVHRQALLDGVDPDEVDIIIKGKLHKAKSETADASAVENKEVTDTVVVVKKETVYDNNESLKEELKSKVMSIWAEGVQGGNSLFMFKKYCSKDFCDTYDKYEKFLNGDFGSLDYDVWTQAQDTDGFKYKVKDILATGERNVTVIMELTNFGQTQQLKVMLVKESDKWVIDDFVNAQHSCKQLMREDMNQ